MLTLGLGLAAGVGILIGGGAVAGCWAPRCASAPSVVRRAIVPGAIAVLVAGVFQELIQLMLQQYEGPVGEFRDFLYTWEGLSPQGAVTIFIVVAVCRRGRRARIRAGVPRVSPAHDHRRERMIWAGLGLARSWCCCRRSPAPMSARC